MPDLERRARRGILFVGLVESARLFERDELGTVNRWRAVVAAIERLVPRHGGRMVKSLGGGLVLEFDAIPGAAACALVWMNCCSSCRTAYCKSSRPTSCARKIAAARAACSALRGSKPASGASSASSADPARPDGSASGAIVAMSAFTQLTVR